ncbi:hypothetical protein BC938DRAFT_475668 [Jimgerdemannia flammicorona]|uniref:Uncharacterized protein n=1 Tax=Jimgerdemannia flammicorona TaxID=994334 RepID=A0A433PQL1_9FUNG|nr:hypothetical protein BC938DRAFT_475668 [Jimgerdemannia flammicorona]
MRYDDEIDWGYGEEEAEEEALFIELRKVGRTVCMPLNQSRRQKLHILPLRRFLYLRKIQTDNLKFNGTTTIVHVT